VLIGTDWREGGGARSDVMMLISIHKLQGTVSVVSFPRDLYINIPNHGMDRINVAKGYTGYDGLFDTFETNFLVRPDYYISTNMQGFTSIVNTLGGIDVYVEQGIQDRCDLPQGKRGYCSYGAGSAHMDGKTALWYVRSRFTSSDLDRLRREQEVLKGMLVKLLSMNAVARAPELYTTFHNSVETNLMVEDIVSLAPAAVQLTDSNRIHRYAVTLDQVTPTRTSTGAAVLMPNLPAIQEMVHKAVFEP
jgi:polyisoprenyl-teichoic acid--peptidoglycan teichoic acid transferase